MKGISTVKQCTLVLLLVVYALKASKGAPLDAQTHSVGDARSNTHGLDKISYRQANEDDSYEDSGEDDGEDDAEQAQQSLIEQQNQQNLEESLEGSDEEGGEDDNSDDVRHRRRRRDVEEEDKATTVAPEITDKEDQSISTTIPPSISTEPSNTPSLNRTSVLILIRDALKKVTTVLPTEQVATNALQYFQLFEHFLQQTIEQVIDDYDEDEDESTTIKTDEALPEKDNNFASTEASNVVELVNEVKVEDPEKTSVDTSSVLKPEKMTAT